MRHASIDYTNKDGQALRQAVLEIARQQLPAWSQSPNDIGVVLVDAFAYIADLILYYQDRIANESYPSTAVEPRSMVNLLRLIGYELEPSKPASVELQLFFEPSALGTRPTLEHGAEFLTSSRAGEVIRFRYLGSARQIDLGEAAGPDREPKLPPEVSLVEKGGRELLRWGSPPSLGRKGVITGLPVVQVDEAIDLEVIGSSDGSPNMRFPLAKTPVLDDSIRVFVGDRPPSPEWLRVETLLYSTPGDPHFMVRRDASERVFVEFGNNTYGQIPLRGVDNIRVSYRKGGGVRGNVGANRIVELGANTADIGLVRCGHELPASGGNDREDLAIAAQRAAGLFRAQNRVVTARDYEAKALRFGAAKAKANSLAWNRVQLYVAPAGGGTPSATFREGLLQHLETRRVLTTVVEVLDPDYVTILLAGELFIEPTFFKHEVQQAASEAVARLFAFDHVAFGQALFISKIYEAVEAVEGVRGLNVTMFKPLGSDQSNLPDQGRIVLSAFQIAVTDGMDWKKVTGGQLAV